MLRRIVIPRNSTSPTAPTRPLPEDPRTLITSDQFNRADTEDGDLGATPDGFSWETDRFRIESGRAIIDSGGAGNLYRAVINAGLTDVAVEATFWPPNGGGGGGLAVRCGAVTMGPFYWLWGNGHAGSQTWRVRRLDGAQYVTVYDTGVPVVEGPHELALSVSGDQLTFKVNGQEWSTTDSEVAGGTRVGVAAIPTNASGTTTRETIFDNIRIYEA